MEGRVNKMKICGCPQQSALSYKKICQSVKTGIRSGDLIIYSQVTYSLGHGASCLIFAPE